MAHSLLHRLVNLRSPNGKESCRPPRKKRPGFLPELEALEERETPTVSFAAQQTFSTGALLNTPLSVAMADFNGDGKPDLVVTNFATKSVTVLLNTTAAGSATASFAAAQTFAVGNGPSSVAVADVNGDGKPDLIVTNSADKTVSVLLNTTATGSATVSFAAQQLFAVGNGPQGVVAGDVNGDNKLDFAVTNAQDNTVSVLLNTTATGSATASFTGQQTFAVGTGPLGLAVGDFNGDKIPDLAVANYSSAAGNTVSVLLNTTPAGAGAVSFAAQQTFAVGNGPYGIAAADFNGDGKPDLVTTNTSDNTVSVLLDTTAAGAASASFAAQQTFGTGTGPEAVAAADLDGDGRPDLAVANYNNGGSSWLSVLLDTTAAGASTPSFAAQQTFAVGFGPQSVAVADLNHDTLPDLAVTNDGGSGNSLSVLLNLTPRANPQSVIAGERLSKSITLTGNVPNGDAFTFKIASNPSHGILSGFNSTTGAVTYASSGSYTGPDSFTFTVTDTTTNVTSAAVPVSITVLPPPTANPLTQTVPAGQATVLTLTGSAPNGDAFTFAVTASPSHGSVSNFLGSSGQIIYTPNANYTGPDSFQFKVTDTTTTLSGTATVTLTVAVPPTANPQSVVVGQGLAKAITLKGSAPNGDAFTFAVTANPAHGALSNFNATTGAVTYTPIGIYLGPDSFQFTVTDTTTSLTSFATVSLTVVPPPTANAQSVFTGQGQAKAVTLKGSAPNGDAFTFAVTANPAHGALSGLNASTGAVTYTPTAGYTGSDSFQFTVTDSASTLTNAATGSVTVLPPPTANPQAVTQAQGKSTALTLTGTAPNGDPVLFAVSANPSHGTLSGLNASTGAVTYTPTGNYTGPDSFTFKVTDTFDGLTSTAAVSLTVVPVTVVGQYGSQGVWQFDLAAGTWSQLTAANASLLATDPSGDVFGEFPHYGVWQYQPGAGWQQLTVSDAAVLTADAQGNLTAEFPGYGVWQHTPSAGWTQLTTVDASLLAAGASGAVVGEFAGAGVWQYTPGSGWKQLTTVDATLLAAGASGTVAGEFAGAGVWQYTLGTGWAQLTASNASVLAEDALGNVVAEFAGSGVWRHTAAAGWQHLTAANASALSTDTLGDFFAEFPGSGVWEYDPARGFSQLNTVDTTILATA